MISSFAVPGKEHHATDIAVNQTTHHVYVAGESSQAIYNFDMEGHLDPSQPEITMPSGFKPAYVAVDNSGGATEGDLYVTGFTGASPVIFSVKQLEPSGTFTSWQIEQSSIPPSGTPQGAGRPNVVNSGEFIPAHVAVDGSGNVFVVERSTNSVDEFSPAGTFIAQFAPGLANESGSIVVDAVGDVWITTNGVAKVDPAGNCAFGTYFDLNGHEHCNSFDPGDRVAGLAMDAAGNLLTGEIAPDQQILEFDSSGSLLSRSAIPNLPVGYDIGGLAVDQASGRVFVISGTTNERTVEIYGPTITLPDATTKAATAVTGSSATLNATVGADGGPQATCLFQYATEAKFEAAGFAEAQTAPCTPAGPFTGAGTSAVHADVAGLNGGTTYRFRILASSSNGSTPGAAETLTTLGPSVRSQSFAAVSETGVRLRATINPRGKESTYRFQLVDQARFAASGYAEATDIPEGGEAIEPGSADVLVHEDVGGLVAGTGYHFRVIAESKDGEAVGPDSRFMTFPPTDPALPDGRAYEQASPVEKNGTNIQGEPNAVQAAVSGGAVTFFANAGLPGGDGAQEFPTYLAKRAPDGGGWSTRGLLPPASTGPNGVLLGWNEELTQSYASNKQVSGPPSIYLRDTDRAITEIASGGKSRSSYNVAAASADGSKVLFENDSAVLAPGAVSSRNNAYVWDRETEKVTLVGALNTGKAPKKGSYAGPYDWFLLNDPTSLGGAAMSYYTQAEHALSTDGSRAFFTAGETGQVYLRQNPTAPQSAVDGFGHCTQPERACTTQISAPMAGVVDPNGEQPVGFLGATPDGATAFLVSGGKLTSDATTGTVDAGRDLYRYTVSSGQLTDLTPDPGDPNGAEVQGLLGMSEDGSYVYFAANGVLAPGAARGNCQTLQQEGACSIYLWHEDQFTHQTHITLVARVHPGIAPPDSASNDHDQSNWSPTGRLFASGALEESAGRVSADGRTLLFRSAAQLTDYDNHGYVELYRYGAGDPGPTCISCDPTNAAPVGSAMLQPPEILLTGPKLAFGVRTRNLSADGQRVFFETPDRLVSADVNGVTDVYEWEANGSGSCHSEAQNGGCLFLLSTGTSPLPSHLADASANGNDAFIFTTQSLVHQDRDELVDVYDVRVGGGIAAQNQSEPPICQGEGCAGTAMSPPAAPSSGSTAPRAGNSSRLLCPKGSHRVRKKGKERCLPMKKHGRGKRPVQRNGREGK